MGLPTHHMLILVLVSGVLQWLLGALWYGVIVRKSWRKLVGLGESEKPKNGIFGMIVSLVSCLIVSYVLIHVIAWAGVTTATRGAEFGIVCWVGFIAPTLLTQHIFENRRANLIVINISYWLLAMVLAGLIMGGFQG